MMVMTGVSYAKKALAYEATLLLTFGLFIVGLIGVIVVIIQNMK